MCTHSHYNVLATNKKKVDVKIIDVWILYYIGDDIYVEIKKLFYSIFKNQQINYDFVSNYPVKFFF